MNVEELFAEYEWAAEEVEPGMWRAAFATERDEEFDLYVVALGDVLHFAVSPFVASASPACAGRLNALLLRLNQQLPLAHFAIDDDGDVNLLASLPLPSLTYAGFAAVVDTLAEATETFAYELRRLAHEPGYRSAALPEG